MGRNSLVGETPRRDNCLGVTSLRQIPINQKTPSYYTIIIAAQLWYPKLYQVSSTFQG